MIYELKEPQRNFIKFLLNLGVEKIITTDYILDLTIDKPDDELVADGESWHFVIKDLNDFLKTIIDNNTYDDGSWTREKLNSLGIYYKRYKQNTLNR